MALVAFASNVRWIGEDADITIRVRNTSARPVTMHFLDAHAWRGSEGFRTSLDLDRNADPLDPDAQCQGHWVPWRSSASHVVRVYGALWLPADLTVGVQVGEDVDYLEVDLSPIQVD